MLNNVVGYLHRYLWLLGLYSGTYIRGGAYIRVGGYIWGLYIWNEVTVSTCGGLIHGGGLIFGGGGGGLYSEVHGITRITYYLLKRI